MKGGGDAPVRHGLDEHCSALFNATPTSFLDGGVDREYVVSVDANRVHTVSRPAGRDAVAVVLLRGRRRDGEAVVACDEQRWGWDGRRCVSEISI